MALIELKNVALDRRLQALDLDLQPGELVGLIGPNGAGKSSLLNLLAGVEQGSGEILWQGQKLSSWSLETRARKIGYLPQRCQSAWALSVRDVISLGRLPWGDENPEKILHAAQQTGVEDWLDLAVDQLSGGEQARVWLARVLAGEPQLLLADEPLASLDLFYQYQILALLRRYAQGERAVLVSMHDLAIAAASCDRLCLLHQGQIQALGSPQQVLQKEHLRAVYQVEVELDLEVYPPRLAVLGPSQCP